MEKKNERNIFISNTFTFRSLLSLNIFIFILQSYVAFLLHLTILSDVTIS
jgi:hypothetical protein